MPRPPPPHVPGLIDAHCHLDYPPMADDLDGALRRAAVAGVEQVVHVACSRSSHARGMAIAETRAEVVVAVGIHPHEAKTVDDVAIERLSELAAHSKVVAIGETGLDYYYDHSTRAQQHDGFSRQLELSHRLGLPVVLHIRDAHADAHAIVDACPNVPGMVHCFTGGPEEARGWLDRGYLLSFSGIATFPKAEPIREAARLCPGDRILVETDAPYLSPVPLRGRKNEPAHVAFTCSYLAELRGESAAALATRAAHNTRTLLAIEPPPSR